MQQKLQDNGYTIVQSKTGQSIISMKNTQNDAKKPWDEAITGWLSVGRYERKEGHDF